LTILNEAGTPDVLSPLHAVNGLAERLPGALVVVVGTRAEAHIVQSLPAAPDPDLPRSPGSARVAIVVLEPDEPPQQGRVATRVIEAAAGVRGTGFVLLVAGRSAELLGVDADFEARLTGRRLDLPTGVVNPDAPYDVPGTLSTDLEDRALAALVGVCPKRRTSDLLETASAPAQKRSRRFGGFLGGAREEVRPGRTRPVVLLGGLASPGATGELAAELERVGVEAIGRVPARMRELPSLGEETVVAAVDPNLTTALGAAAERGARVVRTLTPIGVDGTARFIHDVAAEAGASANELARARSVWEGLEPLRNRVRGKRIFFAGDTGLEVPLARFLADAGAVVLEVGAPRLDRRALAEELQALGPDVDVVQSPDWRGQMGRVDAARPDVVVASPGLHVPLVARGHLCRSPQDFLEAGVHGYEGARRILELLVSTFERAEALDSVNL
jgi:light-independent protochlorophyllide reductase subunit N